MRSNHLIKSGQVSIAAAGSGGSNPQYSTVTGVEGLLADNDDDVAIVLTTGSMSDARYVIGVSISNRGTAQFTLKNMNAIVTVVDYYVIRI